MPTRNPSPPLLTEADREAVQGDLIGDTVFSKRWVLDVLLRLYKHEDSIYTADRQSPGSTVEESAVTNTSELDSVDKDDINDRNDIERSLNGTFENELCQLWDMTANTEVALFLYEHNSKSVLLEALRRTLSPRLMEIGFGIIANLLCVKEIRVEYSDCGEFRREILQYLSVTDALSLVELTRILYTVVSCSNSSSLWIQEFVDVRSHVEELVGFLSNTLNVDLLSHSVEILDTLFDRSEECLDNHVSDGLMTGIIEAFDLLNEKREKPASIISLIHMFYTFSTCNKGFDILTTKINETSSFIGKCLKFFDINEPVEISMQNRLTTYASLLSLLSCLLPDHKISVLQLLNTYVFFIDQFLDYLPNVLERIREESLSASYCAHVGLCFEALLPILQISYADFEEIKTLYHSEVFKEKVMKVVRHVGGMETLTDELKNVCFELKEITS